MTAVRLIGLVGLGDLGAACLLATAGGTALGLRQRHVLAGFDHVELARQQHDELPLLADAARDAAGAVAGAPIEIGARRPEDRGAGVLRDHQPAKLGHRLVAVDRQVGLDEERRAVDMHAVDRDRALRRQRHALRAHGLAVVGQAGDAEEHEGRIARPQLRGLVGIGRHPLPDALHRHLLGRDAVLLDQETSDRRVRVPVVGIVIDPQRRAVLEPDAGRALDLDRQRLERIPDPADLQLLAIERAGLDGGAVVIGHQLVLLVAAIDGGPVGHLAVRPDRPAVDQQIGRAPIERDVEFRAGKARAVDHRLVIAGEQAPALADAGDRDRTEILLEEGLRLRIASPAANARLRGRPARARHRADADQRGLLLARNGAQLLRKAENEAM